MCAWLWAPQDKLWLAVALIAGIGCGHLYDLYVTRGAAGWRDTARQAAELARFGKNGEPQNDYARFMFAAMGHIAKSSGNVTPAHIRFAEQIIKQMGYKGEQAKQAKEWFRQGKHNRGQLEQLARKCLTGGSAADASRHTIIQTLCHLTSLRSNEAALNTLRRVASYLGVAPSVLNEQLKQINGGERPSSNTDTAQEPPLYSPALLKAFACLDLQPGASPDEAKLAYRRLVSRFHPDRLPPSATRAETELAQRRMVELRDALETIQAG